MRVLLRLVLLLLVSGPMAQASLRTAQQARAELGSAIWARVLRVENSNPDNGYPATVYATVFEFDGILWFYTETNGTQSFSLHRGQLEEEKSHFAPLLRAISPAFSSFEIVPEVGEESDSMPPALPNGCFIDSLAALRSVLMTNEGVMRASLLSYYLSRRSGRSGHTVLVYQTAAGAFLIDSAVSKTPVKIVPDSLNREALKVARLVAPASPAKALWLPVTLSRNISDGTAAARIAALPAFSEVPAIPLPRNS